ncbi:MAG: glycosyltransferase family 4 protein [Acidimicrobiales bacterium]|nr:glycosyltransferase family 4 protein [Acidimicrobiales bacterium]
MRLAVDATPLLGPRTGVGTFTAEVLGHLAQKGPDLRVVAFGLTWRGRHDLTALTPPGVATVRRPMAARPLREAWRRFDVPPIEWWTGAIDVVHGPNFVVPPTRRAARVVTVHDLTCVRFPEMCTRDVLAYPALLRRAVARGAWVHAVSEAVGVEVVEHFAVPPDRVRVVPNGAPDALDVDRLAHLAPLGRATAGAERYVLALGTLEPRKDLPSLVAAFDVLAEHDDALRLVVAGPDGWGAQEVGRSIAAAAHRDRIVRLGWVDDHERSALLAGAAVFAYPSRYEGFGLPPLEAAAHRCPVVATTTGALPEVLGDAAEWSPPGDVDGLVEALRTVLERPGRADELVTRGLARLRRYSWDTTVEGLLTLYRDATRL